VSLLIVEDGSGVPDANVYSTLDAFKAYTPRGGLSIPTSADDTTLEKALIRGTAYIEGAYSYGWPGYRMTQTQGLSWPRYEAWDVDGCALIGVPTGIKYACFEAALIELSEPGALTEALEHGGMITREKVGNLETGYASGAPVGMVYPVLKNCLAGILKGNGSVRLSR